VVFGFVVFALDAPGRPGEDRCIYFSGDTVCYEDVVEVARRFDIRAAILNLGAERFSEGRKKIAAAFAAAGLSHRLGWLEPRRAMQADL
jgi:hypothetical protein